MFVVNRKQIKKLNKVGKYTEVVCLTKLDDEFDNIEVNMDTNILAIIQPGVAVKEIFDEILELKDSDMKKKKKKEKIDKLEEKFASKYKKQLKKSLDVEILLYTLSQKLLAGGVAVIATEELDKYEKGYLTIFNKFVEKKLGVKGSDIVAIADEIKKYDGKKKKLPKFVAGRVQEVSSNAKSFVKEAFAANSIFLQVTSLMKNKDLKITGKDNKITIAKEENIQAKRKEIAKALKLANKNDPDAKKFFKAFIKEGRAKTAKGKQVKKFDTFLERADKISLITCLADVYKTLTMETEEA